MILTHEYRRVQANWGSDGDFVTPEGKTIHTGENHTLFMMDHPEMFDGSDDPEDMVGQGWIKTRGYGPIYSIDAGGGMSKTQLDVLQKMVQERCRYSDPQIEVLLNSDLYDWSCDDFVMLKYPNQIKRGLRSASRVAARAVPFITKEDLRFTREGDPFVDSDWLESGLKRLLTFRDEHYSYTGKKKRDKNGRAIFLYEAGQNSIWIGKNHKIYKA